MKSIHQVAISLWPKEAKRTYNQYMCGEKLVKLRGKEKKIRLVRLKCKLKVTVHVGTDQNIEIEIFAEYKYTLNKL